jgi:predicted phosphodiesterase
VSPPAAVLYDIHGNLPALRAVLTAARAAGAGRFVLGGDYALFGPFPAEVLDALRGLPEPTVWIRGNVDRWTANPEGAPADELIAGAIADCRSALGAGVVAELGTLTAHHVEARVRFSHASPRSDLESFLPEPGAQDELMLAGAVEPLQVFGHTHLQFQRAGPGDVTLVNPGSVGMPLDGDPRAAYALLAGDEVELRRVEYDVEAAVRALGERHRDRPWAARTARRLISATPEG